VPVLAHAAAAVVGLAARDERAEGVATRRAALLAERVEAGRDALGRHVRALAQAVLLRVRLARRQRARRRQSAARS